MLTFWRRKKRRKEHEEFALQASLFTIEGRLLLYIESKQKHRRRVAVLRHLREQILKENHSSRMSGHFSGSRTYNVLAHKCWWACRYAAFCTKLPCLCHCVWRRETNTPSFTPYTCATSFPDCGYGHYGSAKDQQWQLSHTGLPRLSDEMATCFSNT